MNYLLIERETNTRWVGDSSSFLSILLAFPFDSKQSVFRHFIRRLLLLFNTIHQPIAHAFIPYPGKPPSPIISPKTLSSFS